MKRNLILAGFVFVAAGLFSGCNDDDPQYTNLTIDTQSLVIDLDNTTEGNLLILEGNGNYKVTSADESIATAVVEGDKVIVTGLQYGTTSLTISDWAKMYANVQVTVDKLMDLVLRNSSTNIMLGESKSIGIYTGNGGYSLTVADPSVVSATVSETGEIRMTALAAGSTTITVSDKKNQKTELSVTVLKELVVDYQGDIPVLTVGEPVVINILDGNGDYSCKIDKNYATSYIKCEMSEDGNSVTITGLKRNAFKSSVSISDKGGRTHKIAIEIIDDAFLSAKDYRYYAKGTLSTGKVGAVSYAPEFNLCQLECKSTGSYASGYAIRYSGDLSVGDKADAVLYKITRNAVDMNSGVSVSDCKVEQAEDGWYWISFQEEGAIARSYIITKE